MVTTCIPTHARLGVDTGGTFTDLLLVDGDNRLLATHKRLSTPDDPTQAVLGGIDDLLRQAGLPDRNTRPVDVVHGSTVATNALLESVGGASWQKANEPAPSPGDHHAAETVFITTAGFEDTLEIARQDRPELYSLVPHRPPAPIPRSACVGVNERLGPDGSVITPLSDTELSALIDRLRALKPAAVVVCLLHSYACPAHEQRIAAAVTEALDEPLHVTLSHTLLPEYREYERAATCTINGVVAPRMIGYLDRLTAAIGEDRLRIMAGHGGTLPPPSVRQHPVRTTLSGPAGGVVGAATVARAGGRERIITLDMGGTSTDVALCDGGPSQTTESEAAGLPVRLPSVDIHTVGAGGGSIAWVDPGGALRVGPHSAGADPGPACYGRQQGEPKATVTDAHVVLGHIPADEPLGEALRLDPDAAQAAVQAVATRAKLELVSAARGILRIAETTMARAVQRISLQRGRDPRDYTLVPFGGAGGLHACRLAEALGMSEVFVPTQPGVLSALGMLSAPPRYTFSQNVLMTLEPDETGRYGDVLNQPALQTALDTLQQQADRAMANEALTGQQRVDLRSVDLRYRGQSYEITVSLDGGDPVERFLAEHERLYGYVAHGSPIELINARHQTGGTEKPVDLPPWPERSAPMRDRDRRETSVYEGEAVTRWWYVRRDALCAGDRFDEPLIAVEYSATTVMPPGWTLRVNRLGQMILTRDVDDSPSKGPPA